MIITNFLIEALPQNTFTLVKWATLQRNPDNIKTSTSTKTGYTLVTWYTPDGSIVLDSLDVIDGTNVWEITLTV